MNKSCLFWIMWTFLQLSVIHLEEVDTTLLKMMLLIGSVSSILLSVFFYKKEVQMSLKQNILKDYIVEILQDDEFVSEHDDWDVAERILTIIHKEREETLKKIEEAKEWVLKNVQIGEYNLHYSYVDQVLNKIKQTLTGEPNE